MTNNSYDFLDSAILPNGVSRLWLIRHAIVEEKSRNFLYGTLDVPICAEHVAHQHYIYRYLATRLPKEGLWFTSPLCRTQQTAQNIQNAGYNLSPWKVEAALLEQNLGKWQGLPHQTIDQNRCHPRHPFWPLSALECPPDGESMKDVYQRVGHFLDSITHRHTGQNIIAITHGGTIRAALAYALQIDIDTALSFSIYNLSLTILERQTDAWRVITVNELPHPENVV